MTSASPAQGVIPPELVDRFSGSIRGVVRSWPWEPDAWELARRLLAVHPSYFTNVPSFSGRSGRTRVLPDWLALLPGLFDLPRVAASPSQVIDVPLALIGLSRMDAELGAALRASGVQRQLERRLGFDVRSVLVPWARARAATSFVDVTPDRSRESTESHSFRYCAVSPDGRRLAAGAYDGVVMVWDLVTGNKRRAPRVHDGRVLSCAFSPTGDLLATAGDDSKVFLWDARAVELTRELAHGGREVRRCPFSPAGGLVATAGADGRTVLWDPGSGEQLAVLAGHNGRVRHCTFTRDGTLLATAGEDGTTRIWEVAGDASEPFLVLPGSVSVRHCVFDPDGRRLAAALGDGHLRVWNVETGELETDVPASAGVLRRCAFNSDGRLVAAVGAGGFAAIWDVAARVERSRLDGHEGEVWDCRFSGDGRVLATSGEDGTVRVWEAASGASRAVLGPLAGPVRNPAFTPDGSFLAAASTGGDAVVWEQQEDSRLAAVVPDLPAGVDLLGVRDDATALANVIAAAGTQPPLSIGLFGDWGSGKSFLIDLIQSQVRRLALRAQSSNVSTPYCRDIRNVTFNAWHYADANLWASLATHIFDALAQEEDPDPEDPDKARRQLARLEEKLAAESAAARRLERARLHADRLRALTRLSHWIAGLALGKRGRQALAEVERSEGSVRSGLSLVAVRPRLGALALGGGAALGLAAAVVLGPGVGLGEAWNAIVSIALGAVGLLGSAKAIAGRVFKLVEDAGGTERVQEASSSHLAAELEAAESRVQELSEEVGDLASGRRLGRFVAERAAAGDYRAQLGLISRIHADFERMSDILENQAVPARPGPAPDQQAVPEPQPASPMTRSATVWRALKRLVTRGPAQTAPVADAAPTRAGGRPKEPEFPRIDRIVLYVDDLDRCPPRRVVEVLEAVHLILALRLFVVVLAVDPRWLLRSLRLHYAEVVAGGVDGAQPAEQAGEEAWRSTPLNYLDKIIQVPFAVRPMARSGVASLVHRLLPVATRGSGDGAQPRPTEASPPPAGSDAAHGAPPPPPPPLPEPFAVVSPSLSPRQLALTEQERAFAVDVAAFLRTPRAVKKFTNLYRLVRARLDEDAGELDRLLDETTGDVPEYKAVLVLLGALIAFAEQASDFLADIGDLDPRAAVDGRPWAEYVASQKDDELKRFLEKVLPPVAGQAATREPFRRWALEVSRYSFETGQEVFARYHTVTVTRTDGG